MQFVCNTCILNANKGIVGLVPVNAYEGLRVKHVSPSLGRHQDAISEAYARQFASNCSHYSYANGEKIEEFEFISTR